ncbi:MAG: N-methyl-L-tryptophan oxidase [Gemmataceae bacterium]|nr:N-methyl-L-tryptophan oxidase [Gemmataceae bacterium]
MTAAKCYDVIVIGLGAMGGAACWRLAQRGCRVLGLDQFTPPHTLGSSHGRSRIIRTAYYEHPAYVPLVQRAFEGWYELEQLTGRHLLTACPCLSLGPADGPMMDSLQQSIRYHQLHAEVLSSDEIRRRYPPWQLPEHYQGILENQAGILAVEDCIWAQLTAARTAGADVHTDEPVHHWHANGSAYIVRTALQTYSAPFVVITAGAWATRLLAHWRLPLKVMRQVMLWFDVGPRRRDFRRDRFPIFIAETPTGDFYGLPALDSLGLKVAQHYGAPELADPDAVCRQTTPEDAVPVRHFVDQFLPGLGAVSHMQVCLYTVSPDRHFVVDRLASPSASASPVVIAAGFSGHGFKFAPVIGEILADLTLNGTTAWNIHLFRAERFNSPCG